jgi:hypothetical protein
VRRPCRFFVEAGLLEWIGGHLEGLLEVSDCLVRCPKRYGAIGGASKRDPGLNGDGVGLLARWTRLVRLEVVTRQDARDLVLAERLKVARSRKMTSPAIGAGERCVGNLTDE